MVNKGLLIGSFAMIAFPGAAQAALDPAQGPGAEGERTVYLPDDFAQYSPVTALDMVRRIPGFGIQQDNTGGRGFGQARGNLLIDGQRISAKTNGAEVALGRIAAVRVVRIELLDGTRLDIPGLSGSVVNVVTDGSASVDGTWRVRARFRENLPPVYNDVNLALSGSRGALSWSVEGDSAPQRAANGGRRNVRDGAGTLIEQRDEKFTRVADSLSVAGALGWKPPSGLIGNLNIKAGIWQPDAKQVSKTYTKAGPEGRRLFLSSEEEWNVEGSGDVDFSFGPGRLKLIGLAQREHSPVIDRFSSGNLDGTNLFASEFSRTIDEGEYILRTEYALSAQQGRDWQVSAEGAFNFLEAESRLQQSFDGGQFSDVQLDLSNSRVEERRGEAILTHGRQLSPRLTLQVSAGAEYSELSQSGDADNKRAFTRPKGVASLSFEYSETLKFVGKIERRVGQLNFFDFVSSVNLDLGSGRFGNTEFVPSQSWRTSLEVQKNAGVWGASTLRFEYTALEDVIDQVPIGNGAGPGNIDSARQVSAETETTLKLSPLGFAGVEITARGRLFDTEVEDPVTRERRGITGHIVHEYSVELRQDVPRTDWAWGAVMEGFKSEPYYLLSEVSSEGSHPAFFQAYLQHKDIAGMTGTLSLGNLANQQDKFWRHIFEGDRNGQLLRTENYSRGFGPILTLELRGAF